MMMFIPYEIDPSRLLKSTFYLWWGNLSLRSQKAEKNYNEINNRNCLISFIVLSKYKYPKFDIYEKLEKNVVYKKKVIMICKKNVLLFFVKVAWMVASQIAESN